MTTRSVKRRDRTAAWTVAPMRSRRGPWRAVATLVVALVVGALLNAEPLQRTASLQEAGWQRDVALAVMDPLVEASRTLHLTAPRRWLDRLVHAEGGAPSPSPSVSPSPPSVSPSVSPSPSPSVPPSPSAEPTQTESPSPTPSATRHVATAADLAVLLVTGDSLTEALGPALVNLTLATGVVEPDHETRYSSGLTRPDFYDWPSGMRARLAGTPTDIVVFMIGANDAQPIQIGDGWEPYGTPAWFDEYRRRADDMAAALSNGARTVYWVGQPIARSESYRARMVALNDIHEAAAAGFDNVRFVSSWELFLDADGGYSEYLPDAGGALVRVRRSDGIHLTPTGGAWLAEEVLRVIAQDWDLGAE